MVAREPVAGRPHFPSGYGISTAKEGLLAWAWAVRKLESSRNYWVVTTSSQGVPHAMPVWGLWLDGAVVFSTSPKSRKGRNLAANRRIVVHLESGDEVVVVEGEARETEIDERLAAEYEAKYDYRPEPGSPGGLWYRVAPRVVYAWLESDYPRSATRFVFD